MTRVTEIDSQYRPILFQCNYPESCVSPYLSPASETIFSSKLTDTLNNTVSLKVSAINIPFSFYNIETNQGNSVYISDISGEHYIQQFQRRNHKSVIWQSHKRHTKDIKPP